MWVTTTEEQIISLLKCINTFIKAFQHDEYDQQSHNSSLDEK